MEHPRPEALRAQLKGTRRALEPAIQRGHSRAVAASLATNPLFLRARRVGAYWSQKGEIDPFLLLRSARASHKRWFLPVLRRRGCQKLWFLEYEAGDPTTKNRFGIPEPRLRNRRIRLPWHLDLLLVPLVGFDDRCNRLGMGGGYYDCTLAYLQQRRFWRRPALVGLAHECQRVPRLAAKPWDVPLDMVVTEQRTYVSKVVLAGGPGAACDDDNGECVARPAVVADS